MSNKTTETITLVDESGIEILVNYTKELETIENGSGFSNTKGYSYTLNCCEIVIKGGNSINITKQLSLNQYHTILDQVIELETENA